MSVKAKKEPQPSPEAAAPLGSVDQIRDIIFGAQMRDYEQRFSALEARLIEEARALREDVQNRFQLLEDNLQVERGERGAATNQVIDELRATASTIHDRAEQDRKEARHELEAAREAIFKRLDAMHKAKTDRAALSGLLREMASELENGATASKDDSGERG